MGWDEIGYTIGYGVFNQALTKSLNLRGNYQFFSLPSWRIEFSFLDVFLIFKICHRFVTDTGSGIIGSWVALVLQYWSRVNGVTLVLSRMKNWKSWYWEAVKKPGKIWKQLTQTCETHPPPQFHSFGTFIVNLPASRQSMPVFNGSTAESRKSRSQTRAKVCQHVDRQKRTENEHNSSDFSRHFLHRYLELKLALFVYNMIWHKFPPTKTEYCQRQRYSHDPTE